MKTSGWMNTTLAALALVALPTEAAAQDACLSAGELTALATFAMPSALDGVIASCAPQVGADAFLATQGPGMVAAYAARKDAAWPAARKAFFRIAESGKPEDKTVSQAMGSLPDAALQPFVEGMIGSMIGAKLKPEQCRTADKLMRLLAPLPPENTAELLSTIFELADADKKAKASAGFHIC